MIVSFYNDTIKLRFDRKVYGVGAGVKIYGRLTGVVFHLDNNEVPVVYLDGIGVIVGGDDEIRFRVFDSEGEILSYQLDQQPYPLEQL